MRICIKDGLYYIIDGATGCLLTVKSCQSEARRFIRHTILPA